MKYEIIKGSEKDFEGAPEWATLRTFTGGSYFFAEFHDAGARVLDIARNDEFKSECYPTGVEIIAERRPITEPVWNGEGLPTVGVECEMQSGIGKWLPVDVIAHKDGFAFGWSYDYRLVLHSDKNEEFRPIRSPEDVAREKITLNMLQYMYSSDETDHAQVCKIYDAIAAGKITGITKTPTVSELMRITENATREDCEAIVKLLSGK